MQSDSILYEITFPDGRKELRRKIGLAEQAAIATAFQFGDRLVVTMWSEPSGEHDMRQGERMDIEHSAESSAPLPDIGGPAKTSSR